jgi:sarcosine oxidase, subunit delta
MKILNCPLNGPRNISEFACLGEVKTVPEASASISEWADFVFTESNPAGLIREWWIHLATNYVFIVERDTQTEAIIRTYRVSDTGLSKPPRLDDTA